MIGCGPRLGKELSAAHPSRISDWDSNSDPLGHGIISARGHRRRFSRVLVRPVCPLTKAAPEALLLPARQTLVDLASGTSFIIGAYKAIRIDGCGVADFRPSLQPLGVLPLQPSGHSALGLRTFKAVNDRLLRIGIFNQKNAVIILGVMCFECLPHSVWRRIVEGGRHQRFARLAIRILRFSCKLRPED